MKHILESGKIFEAYAIIDLCYYSLEKLNEEISKPKSGLDILIDKATGYDKVKMKERQEISISLLKQIIEAKKKIEADYKNDIKALNEITALANKH